MNLYMYHEYVCLPQRSEEALHLLELELWTIKNHLGEALAGSSARGINAFSHLSSP